MAAPSLSANLDLSQLSAQGNALSGLGGDPAQAMAQLGPMYQQSYLGSLGLNQQLLGGLQTGYDTLRSNADQQYGDISKGYQSLYGDVLGRIAGTNQTNMNDINTSYNARAGGATQDLISRGLGNSTVQSAIQRGIENDRQRALTGSQNQFAQLGAGYASALGQAGLQSQQQGANLGANLGQAQLGMLERVNVPYPNAQMYSQLAQMYGSNLQRQQDQARLGQLTGNNGMTFTGAGGGGVGGGRNGFGPAPGPSMSWGGGGSTFSPQGYSAGGFTSGYRSPTQAPSAYGGPSSYEADLGPQYQTPPADAMGALGGGAINALAQGGFGMGLGGGQSYQSDPYGFGFGNTGSGSNAGDYGTPSGYFDDQYANENPYGY